MAPDQAEKRRTPRIRPFVASCRVVEEVESRRLAGYLTDLSPRGAQVSSESAPPPTHSWVVLEVRLGPAAAPMRLPAQVKWVQPSAEGESYAFGLTFGEMSAEEEQALEAVVEEFRGKAEKLSS